MMMRRRMLAVMRAAALTLSIGMLGPVANAQDAYPSRPVRVIVPWGAGSGIDVQTRVFVQALGEALGAPIFVDNKSGAGSLIGYQAAVQAKPDGYTLFVGTNSQFIQQYLHPDMNLDLLRDMIPVTLLYWMPQVLVVNPNGPIKDVPGLIALARSKPGALNYGSGGVGSGSHVLAAAIATRNQLNMVHVPLRSLTSDLVPMLKRGDIHLSFPVTSLAAGPINQGAARPIAVTSPKRLPQWPDVPTLAEVFKDDRYATDSWNALFVPAGTPQPIVRKLFDAAVKAVQSPQHLKSAAALYTVPATSRSPEEFAEFLRGESVKWRDIVRDSGAKID